MSAALKKHKGGQYKQGMAMATCSVCGWVSILTESQRQDTTCYFHYLRGINTCKRVVCCFCNLNEDSQVKFIVVMKSGHTVMENCDKVHTDEERSQVAC